MVLSAKASPHTRSRRKTLLLLSDFVAKREKKGSLSFVGAVYLGIVILFSSPRHKNLGVSCQISQTDFTHLSLSFLQVWDVTWVPAADTSKKIRDAANVTSRALVEMQILKLRLFALIARAAADRSHSPNLRIPAYSPAKH